MHTVSKKYTLDFLDVPVLNKIKIPKLTRSEFQNSTEIPFGSLIMSPLKTYEVPHDVFSLENDGNGETKFEEVIGKMRLDEESYIAAFTALIHMEEAAESKRIKILRLSKAKFTLHSQLESIFSTPFHVIITDHIYSLIFIR